MNKIITEQANLIYTLMSDAMKRKLELDDLKKKVMDDEAKKLREKEEMCDLNNNYLEENYTLFDLKKSGVRVAVNDDFSTAAEIGGFLVFSERSSSRPVSSALLHRLEREIMKNRSVTPNSALPNFFVDRTVRSPFNMKTKIKASSRYETGAIDFDKDILVNMMETIEKFVNNFDYIIQKCSNPGSTSKYKNFKDKIGMFNPICFTELNTNMKSSVDLMQHIGTHNCHFYRIGNDCWNYPKFSRKTLASIEKAVTQLIEIAKNYFDDATVLSIYEYIGEEKPLYSNDDRNPNFVIRFIDGFFAEGKTTKIDRDINEFESFIRGNVSFIETEDKNEGTTLLTIDYPEEHRVKYKKLVNSFLNAACHVMQSYKLYHLIRCRKDNEFMIDRSTLSRLYFNYTAGGGSSDEVISKNLVIKEMFAPLCLYSDMIQALFHNTVSVVYKTDLYVNTMIDVAHKPKKLPERNWRCQSNRIFERSVFSDFEVEKQARIKAYIIIVHQLTSIMNFVCSGLIRYASGDVKIKKRVVQLPGYKTQIMKHMPNMTDDLITTSDYVSTNHFLGLLDAIYNKPIVVFDDKKEPEDVTGKVDLPEDLSQKTTAS